MRRTSRLALVMGMLLVAQLAASCAGGKVAPGDRISVVATVAPIADLATRVGGSRVSVTSLVPRGENGHTYTPRPSDALALVDADAFVDNGLGLNVAIASFAEENLPTAARRLVLGEAVPADERIASDATCHFDHCHPGSVNAHLWPDPVYAGEFVSVLGRFFAELDPPGAATYEANAAALKAQILALHDATARAVATIPAEHRKLVVYHDAWAYFARRYSLEMVGVIQPVNFAEPSAAEVADMITQLKTQRVRAFFGSEVFPSDVLGTIARESGARYVPDLSDDRLPGKPGEAMNSYVGLMASNVRLIVSNLGGDPRALDAVMPR